MSLVRYTTPLSAYRPLSSLDRFFNSFYPLEDSISTYERGWVTKEGISSLEINMAGYDKEDIEVNVSQTVLEVKAKNEKRNNYYSATLPKGSDSKSLTARLDKGILTLEVSLESTSIRKVDIQ